MKFRKKKVKEENGMEGEERSVQWRLVNRRKIQPIIEAIRCSGKLSIRYSTFVNARLLVENFLSFFATVDVDCDPEEQGKRQEIINKILSNSECLKKKKNRRLN